MTVTILIFIIAGVVIFSFFLGMLLLYRIIETRKRKSIEKESHYLFDLVPELNEESFKYLHSRQRINKSHPILSMRQFLKENNGCFFDLIYDCSLRNDKGNTLVCLYIGKFIKGSTTQTVSVYLPFKIEGIK